MPSQLPSNRVWDEAESLIIRLDRLSRSSVVSDDIYPQIALGVIEWSQASGVGLWVDDRDEVKCLASIGQTRFMPVSTSDFVSVTSDTTPQSFWQLSPMSGMEPSVSPFPRQVVSVRILPDLLLQTVVIWDRTNDLNLQDANRRLVFDEVMHAVIEIYAKSFLRTQVNSTRQLAAVQSRREQEIAALYRGSGLADSLRQCAEIYACHRGADRVSILKDVERGCKLIASSASHAVDRRARLAVLMESLANVTSPAEEVIRVSVGGPVIASNWQEAADRYMIESGCRSVEIEGVYEGCDSTSRVALVVTEWFEGAGGEVDRTFRECTHDAIRQAMSRDTFTWTTLISYGMKRLWSRKFAAVLAGVCVSLAMLLFVPVTFTLPVEGRILPEQHRRMFSPADAIVSSVLVKNGQTVDQGQPLFRLRSPRLDLHEEQIRGELLTARTRLASLSASRSGATSLSADSALNALNISSGEQSLKAEISGLEKQLALVESQISELVISSPMNGVVDRWDLEQALEMRPVIQGQLLVDIYDPAGAWNVELELADQHARYLLNASKEQNVWFYVQSQPNRVYRSLVKQIAKSTHVNSRGQSVLQVKCRFEPEAADSHAMGASVWADIECGKRSLGFVWFRGLIEWFERQTWY